MSDRALKVSSGSHVRAEAGEDVKTFVLHEPTDFLPSPEVPDLDNLVSAPGSEPLTTLR